MSDEELVRRLVRFEGKICASSDDEVLAAEAIERLTRERGEARGESLRWQNGCNAALDRAEAAEAKVAKLREAIEAHGMLPNGFCVCSNNRDGEKSNHQPECRDLRAALAETEMKNAVD